MRNLHGHQYFTSIFVLLKIYNLTLKNYLHYKFFRAANSRKDLLSPFLPLNCPLD